MERATAIVFALLLGGLLNIGQLLCCTAATCFDRGSWFDTQRECHTINIHRDACLYYVSLTIKLSTVYSVLFHVGSRHLWTHWKQ